MKPRHLLTLATVLALLAGSALASPHTERNERRNSDKPKRCQPYPVRENWMSRTANWVRQHWGQDQASQPTKRQPEQPTKQGKP